MNNLENQVNDVNNNAPLDTNTSMLELNPIYNQYADYDYEYVFHVRPYITIVNKIPFPINIAFPNGNKMLVEIKSSDRINNIKVYKNGKFEDTNEWKITRDVIETKNNIRSELVEYDVTIEDTNGQFPLIITINSKSNYTFKVTASENGITTEIID